LYWRGSSELTAGRRRVNKTRYYYGYCATQTGVVGKQHYDHRVEAPFRGHREIYEINDDIKQKSG